MSNRTRKTETTARSHLTRSRLWPVVPPTYGQHNLGRSYAVHSPGIGTCLLGAAIYQKWVALGGAQGPLGLPVFNEQPVSDGRGRFALFEWGGIYSATDSGVHAVHGLLFDRWMLAGGAPDLFGYPCTDVLPVNGHGGSICHFEWGTLYTDDGSKVRAVLEPLRSTWLMLTTEGDGHNRFAIGTVDGFGHWLVNNCTHGEPCHHPLCVHSLCTTRILVH